MKSLRVATVISCEAGKIELRLTDGWTARVMLIAEAVGRLSLLPPDGWREPRSWALDPNKRFPVEGKPRDEIGLADPAAVVEQGTNSLTLTGSHLRAQVTLTPFGVVWEQLDAKGQWVVCCADRTSYAYGASTKSGTLSHWQRRDEHDRYFGLGDKTGPLDLQGRRLRTRQLDALGYDAQTGDPLYKHWPFFVGHRADSGTAYGIYYDTLAECAFDFGAEHDHCHEPYRVTEILDGDLDMFVFAGPSLREVIARFVGAIGGTALPPRWSLGYANASTALTDHPQAQEQTRALLAVAEGENFPLSSYHFGSGYTSRGHQRYVFTWNEEKFPAPQELMADFATAGVRVVANIKPCLPDDHPAFSDLAAQGAFVRDPEGPCLEQFGDGWGAHLDFTRKGDCSWWQTQLQSQVLNFGIDAGWNDNNEYELWRDDAYAEGFGARMPMARARPLQALLMTRATYEQQARHKPAERVYTVTRAGPPGLQRYAQVWTGDNSTSWHTMRWNQRMALTMSLSGLFNVGHDIGGFAGPVPDAEMLIRWTQACCLVPRMIMSSRKADGSFNSPWLHAEATAPIRAAIDLRLRLMPYLYTQMWRASREHLPILRPTLFDFGDDPQTWRDCDDMMVGPDLLVAPVFESGQRTRSVYLPGGAHTGGWYDWSNGAFHEGGQWITVDAPLDCLPLFVRGGALLPTTDSENDHERTEETSRALRWYPGAADTGEGLLFEDDGLRSDSSHVLHRFIARVDGESLRLQMVSSGKWVLPYGHLRVQLPPWEMRQLHMDASAAYVPLVT